jgi:hypothetical protein
LIGGFVVFFNLVLLGFLTAPLWGLGGFCYFFAGLRPMLVTTPLWDLNGNLGNRLHRAWPFANGYAPLGLRWHFGRSFTEDLSYTRLFGAWGFCFVAMKLTF